MQLEPGYHLHKGAKVERIKWFYLKMDVFDCHSSNCRKLEVNQKKILYKQVRMLFSS